MSFDVMSESEDNRFDDWVGCGLNATHNEVIESGIGGSDGSNHTQLSQLDCNGSQCSSFGTTDDTNFNSKFDYVMKNLEKSKNYRKLEIIETEFEYNTDLNTDANDQNCFNLSQIFDGFSNEKNIFSESELKSRAEQEIVRRIPKKELRRRMVSLEDLDSVKDLNFDQLLCLVVHLSHTLETISNTDSYYTNIFKNNGFPGIATNINTSMFDKWQQIYIIGCLTGLFSKKVDNKDIYGILFPETLLRIVMKVHKLDYKQAIELINH